MTNNKNIVAAELLNVKDKVSLIDALAFPIAGDHIAGLAGALVGASLVPSKLVYTWRVLYDDGSKGKLKLNGTDPRNNWFMELPYLPDYETYMKGENIMEKQGIFYQPQNDVVGMSNPLVSSNAQQDTSAQSQTSNSSVIIGAGYYEFGGNFPLGVFNLEYISGCGTLQLKNTDDWSSFIDFGEADSATSFFGLNSSEFKSFKLDGNVLLRVSRAGMIQI